MLTFDENIWVEIPDGTKLAYNDDDIYKLMKSLYGLKQASRFGTMTLINISLTMTSRIRN
jgi:hypothetical protein